MSKNRVINIHQKTLDDLEFSTVQSQLSEHCITNLGKESALKVVPFSEIEIIKRELTYTNEYLSSFDNDNRIPNHGFEALTKEIKLLNIENTYLEIPSLQKIVSTSLTVNSILKFLEKFKEYYKNLYNLSQPIDYNASIIEQVDVVVDRFGDIKDNASPALAILRKTITSLRIKINTSFSSIETNLDYTHQTINKLI